jgi:hypothetical protein
MSIFVKDFLNLRDSVNQSYKGKWIVLFLLGLFLLNSVTVHSQIDSLAKSYADTLRNKLIVDDIPHTTFKEKFMYPHRWYIKQILKPKHTDFDTSYILTNKRKLTLTLPVARKFYGFNLTDRTTNQSLRYSPNNYYQVGVNFSNLLLTFSVFPGIKFGDLSDRGTTSSRDYQFTLMGRRVITDLNYQNYRGFYVYNSAAYTFNAPPGIVSIRPDISVISFGVNTMFVYNYKKYSLRGAFSFTDVQRKSAGSFMTGIYHSSVTFSSRDSAFVTYPFKDYFSGTVKDLNRISAYTVGVSEGYGYTLVVKKIICSSALNVGVGGRKLTYTTTDDVNHTSDLNLSAHLNARAAIRYDNLIMFGGVMATYDTDFAYFTRLFNTENYIARIVFFVGYRFHVTKQSHKMLKRMGLIDYKK